MAVEISSITGAASALEVAGLGLTAGHAHAPARALLQAAHIAVTDAAEHSEATRTRILADAHDVTVLATENEAALAAAVLAPAQDCALCRQAAIDVRIVAAWDCNQTVQAFGAGASVALAA